MLTIDVKDQGGEGLVNEELGAVVKALNKTARDVVMEIKADMPHRFILRNSWVQKGIRFNSATRDNPVARVYSVDPYMLKQDDGEVYEPSGHVAIPKDARPTKDSPIPMSMFPKALRSNPNIFKADFSKNLKSKFYPLMGLFQRVQSNHRLKILYILKDRKVTKPHWQFTGQVEKGVDQYFTANFTASQSE